MDPELRVRGIGLIVISVTRDYIRQDLQYSSVLVKDDAGALALESYVKAHGLSGRRPVSARQKRCLTRYRNTKLTGVVDSL